MYSALTKRCRMFDFGMETRRINEIVNIGAADKISDIKFLEKELAKFIVSPARRMMITGERYYSYGHDVLNKRRMVIGENGEMFEDKQLPNNRYIDNRYAEMVEQKVSYLLSKPFTINADCESYVNLLKKVFNKKFMRLLKNIGKDSYNGGISWIYPHYDENGNFKLKKFKPYEVLPFWKDETEEELDFALRIYDIPAYEGERETTTTFVELYAKEGIYKFRYKNGSLIKDYQTYYFEIPDLKGEAIPYNWERVPLIPFRSNSNAVPLIKKCKSLQDGINQILSSFADGMEENASGNTIIVLKNYDGQNLGEFRRNLAAYKAVKVRTVDNADGGIDKLEITVNADNYKIILTELRKALMINCKGYDIEELKSSGSPNEMSIKAVYSNIDLDANEMETEYQAGFEDLLWFINAYFSQTGKGNFNNETVEIIFNRDMMVNESQVIADINNSIGLLSHKTCVAMHPYTSNVEEELKQIEKEKQATADDYDSAFNPKEVAEEDEE